MMGKASSFMTDAFSEDSTAADLMYLDKGIHIVYGTVGSLASDVFRGKYKVPFVFRSEKGDLAVGGLKVKSGKMAKDYIVSAVLAQVDKVHKSGKKCTLNPIFCDPDGRNFLVLTVVEADKCKNLTPLGDVETFVRDWVQGYPGVYL